jgi:NAD(P)-dependent dehydrogenase (short-subunit alcohol dehydrogenase family)
VINQKLSLTLITGASSGIGRETAISLSGDRNLILHGRDLARLQETLSMCSSGKHLIWVYDLKDKKDLSASLLKLMTDNNIFIDTFLHIAGMVAIHPARMLSHETASSIMSVNCLSALEITAVLVKRTNQKRLKNITFISSIWSQFGAKGYTLYCASKGALDSAMRALALELAPDIRVNSLLLGAIETPLSQQSFADLEIKQNFLDDYPLGIGEMRDAATAIKFLISSDAKWITGQQIVVDGGRTINMSPK